MKIKGSIIALVVVIGLIALVMLSIPIPSLVKYFVLVVTAWVVSNMLVISYRRFVKPKIFAN